MAYGKIDKLGLIVVVVAALAIFVLGALILHSTTSSQGFSFSAAQQRDINQDQHSQDGEDPPTPTEEPEATDDENSKDDEDSPTPLVGAFVAGLFLGGVLMSFIMRRRVGKLRKELNEARVIIDAIEPAKKKRRRPSPRMPENSSRSIAAAKLIGGQTLLKTGQATDAYLMFLDAIEHDEDDADAWLWAGVAAMKMKKYDIAQQTLLQARSLGNEKAEDALRKLKDILDRRASPRAAAIAAELSDLPDIEDADTFPDFDFGDPPPPESPQAGDEGSGIRPIKPPPR